MHISMIIRSPILHFFRNINVLTHSVILMYYYQQITNISYGWTVSIMPLPPYMYNIINYYIITQSFCLVNILLYNLKNKFLHLLRAYLAGLKSDYTHIIAGEHARRRLSPSFDRHVHDVCMTQVHNKYICACEYVSRGIIYLYTLYLYIIYSVHYNVVALRL